MKKILPINCRPKITDYGRHFRFILKQKFYKKFIELLILQVNLFESCKL